MPKSFLCPDCGSNRFYRRRCVETVVDFGQMTSAGHPRSEGPEQAYTGTMFLCVQCGLPIKRELAEAMEAEFSDKSIDLGYTENDADLLGKLILYNGNKLNLKTVKENYN